MKKNIPLAIVIILGFIFVGWTFIPAKWMQDDFYTAFLEFTKTMSPFAVFLGIYSLVSMHYLNWLGCYCNPWFCLWDSSRNSSSVDF